MTTLAFCDTETTGLDPDRHEIWEVALLLEPQPDAEGKQAPSQEHHWFLPVDLGKADPYALTIGGFYERWEEPVRDITRQGYTTTRSDPEVIEDFAKEFAKLTHGTHLVGAVPSFDEERLRKLLRRNGACPGWHYQPIDVETLIAGFLRGSGSRSVDTDVLEALELPWDSNKLSMAAGVNPDLFERHTALGDVLWAKALWGRVFRGVS